MLGDTGMGRDRAFTLAQAQEESGHEPVANKHDDQVIIDSNDSYESLSESSTQISAGEHSQPAAMAEDVAWEITELIGREVIGGTMHYLVQWKPTFVPEDEISAAELIGEFEAKFGARNDWPVHGPKVSKKIRPRLTKDGHDKKTRRRGRPRKLVLEA